MAQPSRAGNTTKHAPKKRKTKQAQHQEEANNSHALNITKILNIIKRKISRLKLTYIDLGKKI